MSTIFARKDILFCTGSISHYNGESVEVVSCKVMFCELHWNDPTLCIVGIKECDRRYPSLTEGAYIVKVESLSYVSHVSDSHAPPPIPILVQNTQRVIVNSISTEEHEKEMQKLRTEMEFARIQMELEYKAELERLNKEMNEVCRSASKTADINRELKDVCCEMRKKIVSQHETIEELKQYAGTSQEQIHTRKFVERREVLRR